KHAPAGGVRACPAVVLPEIQELSAIDGCAGEVEQCALSAQAIHRSADRQGGLAHHPRGREPDDRKGIFWRAAGGNKLYRNWRRWAGVGIGNGVWANQCP